MKIAICINGHPHQYKMYHKTWIRLIQAFNNIEEIKRNDYAIDTFIHAWNFNIYEDEIIPVSENDLDEYIRFMNPRSYIIDDYKKYTRRIDLLKEINQDNSNNVLPFQEGSYLYGILMSSHLKRKFELQSGTEYDICFNLNTRISILTENINRIIDNITIPQKKMIYPAITEYVDHFPHDSVSSHFFYSDSQTFDVLCSFYNFLPHFKSYVFEKNVSIDEVFAYFIRVLDIKVCRLNLYLEHKLL